MKVKIKVKGTQVKLPVKERKNEHAKRRADNSLRPHISRPCCDPKSSEPSDEEENDRKILNSGAFDFFPSSMLKNYTGIPQFHQLRFQ